jgi:hypothetical protein
MSHQHIENFNSQMSSLIKKIIKNGKRYETDSLYRLNEHFLHDVTNKGDGICGCNHIIRQSNGDQAIRHTCGAGLWDVAGYFGKSIVKSATKRMANNEGEGITNKISKLDDGTYQKDGIRYLPQHMLRTTVGSGFGWGRSDMGNTDHLIDWAKQGIETAKDVAELG